MPRLMITLFYLIILVNHLCVFPLQASGGNAPLGLVSRNWLGKAVIPATTPAPTRTAVLIIAPARYGNSFTEKRWALGRKTWEQYMNSHPDVDCYFVTTADPKKGSKDSEQVWIEGDTIFVGDEYQEKYKCDRILFKTVAALKYLLPNYSHFVRTNVNTFFNLSNLHNYMETHHTSFLTTPNWEKNWYVTGYGMLFTRDVANHIVNEYERIAIEDPEFVSHRQADDFVITALVSGVWPETPNHPFRGCPSVPTRAAQLMTANSFAGNRITLYGVYLLPPITLQSAVEYCEQAGDTPILYRNREGLSLQELVQLYEYLLEKNYPALKPGILTEYLNLLDAPTAG